MHNVLNVSWYHEEFLYYMYELKAAEPGVAALEN